MARATYREQFADFTDDLRGLFVGDRTFGDAVVPPVVFVVAERWIGVNRAVALAFAAAGVFVFWRWRKRASATYAFGGVATVAVAAFFALRSGEAEDFFIPGIATSFFWAGAGTASILVRKPFVVFFSAFYRGWPVAWYWRDDVRPAYSVVGWWWVLYTLGRGVGQLWLFADDRLELLLTFKLATGLPVAVPLLFAGYVYGNRKLHALAGPNVEEFVAGADPPYRGGQHGF